MSPDQLDAVKLLYKQYLLSESKHFSKVCANCGCIYSHPLNYCVNCPGRIVEVKLTVIDEIKKYFERNRLISDYIYQFAYYYKEKTGLSFPFEEFRWPGDNRDRLYDVLMVLLGRKPLSPEHSDDVSH